MADGDRIEEGGNHAAGRKEIPAEGGAALSSDVTKRPPQSSDGQAVAEAAAAREHLLERAMSVVRQILRSKFRTTLHASETSAAGEEARELESQVQASLWRAIATKDERTRSVEDVTAYAAAATRNAFADLMRRKYPNRASFARRLRRLLKAQSGTQCHLFEGAKGETWCTQGNWTSADPAGSRGRLAGFEHDRHGPALARVLAKPASLLDAGDLNELVTTILGKAGGPLPFEDVVEAATGVLRIEEAKLVSLSGDEDEDASSPELPNEASLDKLIEERNALRRIWQAISSLERKHRLAFLLNPPHGADIDVFVKHGIASIAEIGKVLALGEDDYALLSHTLHLDDAGADLAAGKMPIGRRIYQLWNNLPLPDSVIAKLLNLGGQQAVINLRHTACTILNRLVTGPSRA